LKKVGRWFAAAALLFVTATAAQAQDVELPVEGTTEYNLSGAIVIDPTNSWTVNALWAPFVNPNFQWGVQLNLFDGDNIDTSGTISLLANWHFVPQGGGQTVPFVGASVGTAFGDLEGTVFGVQGGIKHFLTSETSFNVMLQFLFPDEGDDIIQILFGLSIYRR
jgi:hypothetical protein